MSKRDAIKALALMLAAVPGVILGILLWPSVLGFIAVGNKIKAFMERTK